MCCIFTCFGWMIDLFQRLWTFTMACFISSAVCCSLVTAAISGIALGYNYSLAEYIDLKETNVSIYIKRGIFDDEIADDTKWRRSGHLPVAGHIKEENLITGSVADEPSTSRSGRRLEDSIYQSNDKDNFEDSLMRLTAKAPDYSSTIESPREMPIGATTYQDVRVIPNFAHSNQDVPKRRMPFDNSSYSESSTFNSIRKAVPADNINDPIKWMLPNLPPQAYSRVMLMSGDLGYSPTYPTPITPRPGPVRPTRPRLAKPETKYVPAPSRSTQKPEVNVPKSIDEEMDTFKEKFMMENGDFPRLKENNSKSKINSDQKETDEDYEHEIKGVPLSKKRNIFKLQEYNENIKTNFSKIKE